MAYADVEELLIGWLATELSVRCVTDLPANVQSILPVVQVTRFGGTDRFPTLDQPHVDIDCYAADRAGAHDIAEQVRSALRFSLRGQTVDGAVVSRVETLTGPSWRPYEDEHLRRFGASYRITIHSTL